MDLKKDTAIKSVFKGLLIILLLVLSVSMIPSQNAEAASKKSKALKAYSQLLSKSKLKWGDSGLSVSLSKCSFGLIYVDNNSVPELVISSPETSRASGYQLLYTYKNGKAKYVSTMHSSGFYYKKTGIFGMDDLSTGIRTMAYYRLSSGKAKYLLRKSSVGNSVSYQDMSTNKSLTKAKFNKKLKQLVGSNKKKTMKTPYANIASNRKKYLK